MASDSYDTVAEKVLLDLEMAVRKDPSINEFDVVPIPEAENRNSSPILKGEYSLGLESWIIPHIYPFAHQQILLKNNYKSHNLEKVISCLLGVALLNPEMSTAWSRRRELILSKRMQADNELRLTRMALSRKPKSNEALAHRRWIITEILKEVKDKAALLREELTLSEMIANRYHSNYSAWSHRMWSMQHLLPNPHHWTFQRKLLGSSLQDVAQPEIARLLYYNISKAKYLSIVNSEVFCIYTDEVENNFKWISSHVSDHSGLHFRTFLINEIFDFLKVTLHSSSNGESESEENSQRTDAPPKSATCFFPARKLILVEFLKATESDNRYTETLEEYLTNLEQNASLFDLILSVIISELKTTHSLCLLFPGHEALWYYRRYLIYFFKQYVDGRSGSDQSGFTHQDTNGVPHRKDFRFDYTLKSDHCKLSAKLADLFRIFHDGLIKNEEEIIVSVMKSSDNHEKKLVRYYEHWLKNCFQITERSV